MENTDKNNQKQMNKRKKPYSSPALTIHGDIVSLTGAGGKVTSDSMTTKSVT